MKRRHGRAWVVYLEGTQHDEEVVTVLSARMSVMSVSRLLEQLYPLLASCPSALFDAAAYRSPRPAYPAEQHTINSGVPVDTITRCGVNPYLVAVLALNVVLEVRDTDIAEVGAIVSWTMPDRLVCDGPRIIEKIAGIRRSAPFRVPINTGRQEVDGSGFNGI